MHACVSVNDANVLQYVSCMPVEAKQSQGLGFILHFDHATWRMQASHYTIHMNANIAFFMC